MNETIKLADKILGNHAYMMVWVHIGNRLTTKYYDTEKEVLDQYRRLLNLGYNPRNIAIYIACEVKKE